MNINGKKVLLRAIEKGDKNLLYTLVNDPDTERMIGGSSFPVSDYEQENWMNSQIGRTDILRCVIALKEKPEQGLGTVILSDIDMKDAVAQAHIKMADHTGRRKGYGTDALSAMVHYAFSELRLNCIYAEILSYNILSQKLFEKCGFQKEGVLRERVFKGGKFENVIVYSLLKTDVNDNE